MFSVEDCLTNYLTAHTDTEPHLLKELNRETHQKTTQPHMISGHLQGRFLSLISKIHQPQHILEIGTFTGYSALCLAEGLPEDGKLWTIDTNDEMAFISKNYFEKSAFSHQIESLIGDALELIPRMQQCFDLVFIDAHKPDYAKYFEAIQKNLKVGSLVLFDNVLWHGKVINPSVRDSKTQIIRDLNLELSKNPLFEKIILPIRDGIYILRKIQ